jgi:phosphoribosylformylglycinamidine synthase
VGDAGEVTRASFQAAGLAVILLGPTRGGPLGGSEYVTFRTGEVKGPPPRIDLALEASLQALLLDLLRARPGRLVESAHDVSDGGLAIALAECCTATDDAGAMVGAEITIPEAEPLAAALFGEAPSRVVIAARTEVAAEIERRARERGVPATRLGTTGGDRLSIRSGEAIVANLGLAALREAREGCLAAIVGA